MFTFHEKNAKKLQYLCNSTTGLHKIWQVEAERVAEVQGVKILGGSGVGGASMCSIPFCPFPFRCPTKSAVQSKNVMTLSNRLND